MKPKAECLAGFVCTSAGHRSVNLYDGLTRIGCSQNSAFFCWFVFGNRCFCHSSHCGLNPHSQAPLRLSSNVNDVAGSALGWFGRYWSNLSTGWRFRLRV